MNARSQDNFASGEFEKDYSEAVKKLNQAIRDSQSITKAIDEKLNEGELEKLMVLMRELMPITIQNLSTVYRFLNKYESKRHVEKIAKDDLCGEETKPNQK